MGRPRKHFFNIHSFENFRVRTELYKGKVFNFQIRFNYRNEREEKPIFVELKKRIDRMFKEEFEVLRGNRNIFDVEMCDYMQCSTGHCTLSCYCIFFDGCEEYVLEHTRNLMEKLEGLFKSMGITIIFPKKF